MTPVNAPRRRRPRGAPQRSTPGGADSPTLRLKVATYNVHSCIDRVCARLQDVQTDPNIAITARPTFLSFYPLLRLDHIFVSQGFATVDVRVPRTAATRRASDHLPVIAELVLCDPAGAAP